MKTLREYIEILDEISRRDFLKGAGVALGLGITGIGRAQETGGYGPVATVEPGYADRVRQKLKPLLIYDARELLPGENPAVVVLIDLAPDGTILKRTLVKSSDHPNWDKAVWTALARAGSLPRDSEGKIPMRQIKLTFKPKD